MSLALMKMVVLGTVKVERNLGRMGTDAAGLEWEVNLKILYQSGKKRCAIIYYKLLSLFFLLLFFQSCDINVFIKWVHEK